MNLTFSEDPLWKNVHTISCMPTCFVVFTYPIHMFLHIYFWLLSVKLHPWSQIDRLAVSCLPFVAISNRTLMDIMIHLEKYCYTIYITSRFFLSLVKHPCTLPEPSPPFEAWHGPPHRLPRLSKQFPPGCWLDVTSLRAGTPLLLGTTAIAWWLLRGPGDTENTALKLVVVLPKKNGNWFYRVDWNGGMLFQALFFF